MTQETSAVEWLAGRSADDAEIGDSVVAIWRFVE
jgi:hypothetical protein